MSGPDDFPSLMDEPQFLAELEKVECSESASADRAINVVRTIDRWKIPQRNKTSAGIPERAGIAPFADPPAPGQIRAAVPLFLMMLIGVCAGAASSALILHDRVARLIALWSH
jgi:hypothetical protein